jgi:hypothetical protein
MEILPVRFQANNRRRAFRRWAHLKVFSGLVRADRWRMVEWRLAAQQQKRERVRTQQGAGGK